MTSFSTSELLNHLRQMDEYEFEQLIADIWEKRGWDTKVTTGSNDRGIDIIATRDDPFAQKHLIQAKRYGKDNAVSSTEIQQYSSLKYQESNVDAVIVVTTSYFSNQAQNIADDLNLKLIDSADLEEIICESDWQELLQNYIKVPSERTVSSEKPVTNESISKQKDDTYTPSFRSDSSPRQIDEPHSEQKPEIGIDVDESEAEIKRANYPGDTCPVCLASNSIWEVQRKTKKERYICESCDAMFAPKVKEKTYSDYSEYSGITGYIRFLINEQRVPVTIFEVIRGEKNGEKYTYEEWKRITE